MQKGLSVVVSESARAKLVSGTQGRAFLAMSLYLCEGGVVVFRCPTSCHRGAGYSAPRVGSASAVVPARISLLHFWAFYRQAGLY